MIKLHIPFLHYNVWKFYFCNICFLGYIITPEWWLIYSCQGYFDHLSKETLKLKDFFFIWGSHLTNLILHTAHTAGCSCSLSASAYQKNDIKYITCPFLCALREERHSNFDFAPPHNSMIGRADIFLETATYAITNTNHFTKEN